jgi:glycosyltransferase involved in cell wall biosynthesis
MAPNVDHSTVADNPPSLSIFFPMYNEEENIGPALGAAQSVCEQLVGSGEISWFELIVVNDASTDSTGVIADRMAQEDSRIRVVHHPVNRKLGGSMKTGFAAARGDLILYSDADLPFDMAEAAKAVRIQRLYEADIVSAYRLDRTTEGMLRAVYTHVYNALISGLFGVRMRDVNFSFKLCRRAIFDDISLKSEGSFIDAELIIKAMRSGRRVMQFGTDYFPRIRGESTLASASVIRKILSEMWALRGELKQSGS